MIRVLVAYGSSNGSTAEIAMRIAATLREEGLVAQTRPAGEVTGVAGFDAVVLGGAVYSGRWHQQARRFARRHAKALDGRPVWLFSSGPLGRTASRSEVPPVPQVAAIVTRLHALGHVTFGGRLAADARGFVARAMVRGGLAGDFRDTDAIQAWARSIAHDLSSTNSRRS